MQIERKLYQELLAWKKETAGRKAMLIEGARRVGKSTLAEAFAREQYKSYILIDFNVAPKNVRDSFDRLNEPDVFFQTLSLAYNTRLYPRESLIIFDEIQAFPKARQAIKYLVADGRYDFLETGSLISIKENVEHITIPSEERRLKMYPVDFPGFLAAMGEQVLRDHIRECFLAGVALAQPAHARAMRLFREYMLVGGMPQSIVAYAENGRDFYASDVEKRDILNLYRDDIRKASRRYNSRVSALFENIPGYLSTHEKKVVLRRIEEGARYAQYDDPLFWLDDSMICNLCYRCNDPNVGIALNRSDTAVKCYMGDTGLLVSLAFSENEVSDGRLWQTIMDGKLSLNEGMIYENAISQMITAAGRKLYFYTRYNAEKHRNDIEIDFLLSNESKTRFRVYPVEVKSARNYTATSFNAFRAAFSRRVGQSVIVHPKAYSTDADTVRLPPYMFPFFLAGKKEERDGAPGEKPGNRH
ncbi:MAG: ATP-binding protein [Schwartzia sp.]|nr:ATP-binding protein [Schwartzia sp. (in: firmicutes)]